MDVITGSSEREEELKRWEQPNRRFVEFPKMVYRASLSDSGTVAVTHWIVKSADEERAAERDGWCHSPDEAKALYEGFQQDIARAAAEAAGQVRGMTARAQAEYAAEERANEDHVTDVPAKRSHKAKPRDDPKEAA